MTEPRVFQEILGILQNGSPALAERICREHLAESPDEQGLLLLLSLSLQRQERYAEAVSGYERLTEIGPQTAAYWTNYATALRLAGRAEEAIPAASKAVALAPTEAVHYVTLGQAQ